MPILLAVALVAGCGEAPDALPREPVPIIEGGASPDDVGKRLAAALREHDDRAYLRCFLPEDRRRVVAAEVSTLVTLTARSDGLDTIEGRARRERLHAILAGHGATVVEHFRPILSGVKDLDALWVELRRWSRRLPGVHLPEVHVLGTRTAGEEATVTLLRIEDDGDERREELRVARRDGRWYVELAPESGD